MKRVSARHNLSCTAANGRRIGVRFSYDMAEPYSVYLTFLTKPELTWEMARELVALGLDRKMGELDVKFLPKGGLIDLELSNGATSGTFTFRRTELLAALEKTYELVPLGKESPHVDWSGLKDFPGVMA